MREDTQTLSPVATRCPNCKSHYLITGGMTYLNAMLAYHRAGRCLDLRCGCGQLFRSIVKLAWHRWKRHS